MALGKASRPSAFTNSLPRARNGGWLAVSAATGRAHRPLAFAFCSWALGNCWLVWTERNGFSFCGEQALFSSGSLSIGWSVGAARHLPLPFLSVRFPFFFRFFFLSLLPPTRYHIFQVSCVSFPNRARVVVGFTDDLIETAWVPSDRLEQSFRCLCSLVLQRDPSVHDTRLLFSLVSPQKGCEMRRSAGFSWKLPRTRPGCLEGARYECTVLNQVQTHALACGRYEKTPPSACRARYEVYNIGKRGLQVVCTEHPRERRRTYLEYLCRSHVMTVDDASRYFLVKRQARTCAF